MPYVEGETLRERLDREKQLPVDEAVRIAVAVAGALDYAHRHGVVHRDIKPGNILMQDEQPVVGDFGIALAVGAAGGTRLTETGLSVGTPYYMSPEQATGDMEVGPPSDIYALGAVLYELLTGEPPYTGKTAQAVLGRIIQGTPVSATALRRAVPANVDGAIRKALEKLPADRFTAAQDFAHALQDPAFRYAEAGSAVTAATRGAWRWVAAALAVTTVGFAAAWMRAARAPLPARPVERFSMPFLPGDEVAFTGTAGFALSPDGTMLVYRHVVDGQQILVVRRWSELAATPIRETVGALFPAVSPDGRLAFQHDGEIKVLAFAGGPVRTLGSGAVPRWGPHDDVYFTMPDDAAARAPANGGAVDTVLAPDSGRPDVVWDVLPKGRKALVMEGIPGDSSTEIIGLDLGSGKRTKITPGDRPRYLAPGYLVFGDAATRRMMAAPFDPKSMKLLAPPVPVLDSVAAWSLSDDGKLFYTLGGTIARRAYQMIWVDRKGVATPVDPAWTWQPSTDPEWALSPDGTRLALLERTADGPDVWVKTLDAGARSRLTYDGTKGDDRWPIWRPGTDEVTYVGTKLTTIWTRRADGVGEPKALLKSKQIIATIAWSPDGKWLLLRTSGPRGNVGRRDIFGFRPGVDTVPVPMLADSAYDEMYPAVSPDGRYIANESTETGRTEIYVRPFPDVNAGKWGVSVHGGRQPRWSPRGNELFFQGMKGEMMVAKVRTRPAFHADAPVKLFDGDNSWLGAVGDIMGHEFVVGPDGQRFMMARQVAASDQDSTTTASVGAVLVENFLEVLKARVSGR
jgi:eukaryotic-like serine/threonine-protein kinase